MTGISFETTHTLHVASILSRRQSKVVVSKGNEKTSKEILCKA